MVLLARNRLIAQTLASKDGFCLPKIGSLLKPSSLRWFHMQKRGSSLKPSSLRWFYMQKRGSSLKPSSLRWFYLQKRGSSLKPSSLKWFYLQKRYSSQAWIWLKNLEFIWPGIKTAPNSYNEIKTGMCHTVIWDVKYGKVRVKNEIRV